MIHGNLTGLTPRARYALIMDMIRDLRSLRLLALLPDEVKRYAAVGALPLAALAGLSIAIWIKVGLEMPYFAASLLPSVLAFLLWLRVIEQKYGFFDLHFSPLRGAACTLCFVISSGLMFQGWDDLRLVLAVIAAGCGLFAALDPARCQAYAAKEPRLTALALTLALMVPAYYLVRMEIWQTLSYYTSVVVQTVMQFADARIEVKDNGPYVPLIMLATPHYRVNMYFPCSGVDGIFLFWGLLAATLLLDWRLLSKTRFFLLFAAGFFYMFAVNCLRVALLFLLGHWAWAPGGSPFAASMRGMPQEIFHSWLGWVLYLVAFGVFMFVVYRRTGRHAHSPD